MIPSTAFAPWNQRLLTNWETDTYDLDAIETAAGEGHLHILSSLLEELEDSDRLPALYKSAEKAVDKGRLNILKDVLERIKNSKNDGDFLDYARQLFEIAAAGRHLEVVQYLYALTPQSNLNQAISGLVSAFLTLPFVSTTKERLDILLFLLNNNRAELALAKNMVIFLVSLASFNHCWDLLLFLLPDCIQFFNEDQREENIAREQLQSNLFAVSCAATGKGSLNQLQKFFTDADTHQISFPYQGYVDLIEISLRGNSLEIVDYLIEQFRGKNFPVQQLTEAIEFPEDFIIYCLMHGNVLTLQHLLKKRQTPLSQESRMKYLGIIESHLKNALNPPNFENLLKMCWFLSDPHNPLEQTGRF